ncbi:MAG: phage tail tape measure protein [Planctomycetes bacterium]|nr:phage tail tape measure protein [Planctomycetota bacterium]
MANAGGVRAGAAYVEIFAKDGQFQASLNRIQNRMKAVGTAMRQVGTQMAIGGAAIGTPMVMALRQFTAFDDAIRMTGAVSQATAPQLAQLTNTARELGATTSFTATQVALLMGELGRAGFSPDQIEDMTGAVLDLSRATGTDATASAGIMAATLRQFGMGATDAARVADVLTAAANKTFNSVEGLGEAMQYAGPVAASMGMDIEQTAAILGTLGNVGIQGSEAGTALRRLLTITGAEAQKLQEIFGVSFLDAAGNVRPLVDTLGEVAAATNGMATGLRTAKFNEAFGLLGITAAGAIGAVAADTRVLEQELRRAGGTANITAKQMDAGLGGSLRILMSAIEGVSLAFGDALAPSLQVVAKGGQLLADVLRNLLKDFPIIAQVAAGVAGGLFGLGAAAIVGGLAMQVMARGVGLFAATLRILPALFSPVGVGLAILAGGVTLGVVAARQLSPAFREETDAIMAALGRLDFATAWQIMNLNFSIALVEMAATADQTLRQVQGFFEATGSFIGDMLIQGLDRFMGLFGADIITLQESFEKLGIYFRAAFDWKWAATSMSAALDEAEKREKKARARAPTADARADARAAKRQESADQRQAEMDQAQAGWEATANELRDDLRRAKETPTEAPPGSPQAGPAPWQPGTPPGGEQPPTATTAASGGGRTVGGFFSSGEGLGIGPDLAEPAKATADNTKRTADATEAMAAQAGVGGGSAVGAAPSVAAMSGGPPPNGAGSAVGGTSAAAAAPGAAAQAREGLEVVQAIRSMADRLSTGLEAVVAAVNAHAKLTEAGNGLLSKIVDNTGRPGAVFS